MNLFFFTIPICKIQGQQPQNPNHPMTVIGPVEYTEGFAKKIISVLGLVSRILITDLYIWIIVYFIFRNRKQKEIVRHIYSFRVLDHLFNSFGSYKVKPTLPFA